MASGLNANFSRPHEMTAELEQLRYLVFEGMAGKAPRVNATNNHWEVYDNDTQTWVDTGVEATGADGVSPEITITSIFNGRRIKITDREHPNGQTFDLYNGTDGHSPYADATTGTWWVYDDASGLWVDSHVTAVGVNGKSPYINSTGYWVFWNDSTGAWVTTNYKAAGRDGENGHSPYIGENGHWFAWSESLAMFDDTGIPAQGAPGTPGTDGADGYSPVVTITTITGGHRVTITDEEHPQGQSIDVMNGESGAEVDPTLTEEGMAADSAAVGAQLNTFSGDGTTEVRPSGSLNLYISAADAKLQPVVSDDCRTAYFPCLPNTQYSVKKSISSAAFSVGWTTEFPAENVTVNGFIRDLSATSINITTGANAAYIVVYYAYNESNPEGIYYSLRLSGAVTMTLRQKIASIDALLESLENETDSRLDALENAQIETDSTLTVAGAAADAEAVGLILGTADYDLSDQELWEQGAYSSGAPVQSTTRIRMKGYLPINVKQVTAEYPYAALLFAFGQDGSYIGYWDDGVGGYTKNANGTFKNTVEIPDDGYQHTLIVRNGNNLAITPAAAENVTAVGGSLIQRVESLEAKEAILPPAFATAMINMLLHTTGTFDDENGQQYINQVLAALGYRPGSLPALYQEVEYVAATGSQVIVIPKNVGSDKLRFEIGVYRATQANKEEAFVCGNITKNDSSNVAEVGLTQTAGVLFAFSQSSAKVTDPIVVGNVLDIIAEFKPSSPYATLSVSHGSTTLTDAKTTANNPSLANVSFITLFGSAKGGNYFAGRIYYCRVYADNNMILDLIPCYRRGDNVIGFYDMVGLGFYSSEQSGLTKGGDVL